jgi:hypothetical protein
LSLNCCAIWLLGSYSIVMNLTAVIRASALFVSGTIDVVIWTADASMKKPEEKVSSRKASKKITLTYTVETLYPLFIIFIDNRKRARRQHYSNFDKLHTLFQSRLHITEAQFVKFSCKSISTN